jgi:hypothetical protein
MKTIPKQNILSAALACSLAFTITGSPAQDVSPPQVFMILKKKEDLKGRTLFHSGAQIFLGQLCSALEILSFWLLLF